MDAAQLKKIQPFLLGSALLGFLVINLPFLYYATFRGDVYQAALNNRIALIFMGEAVFIMLFIALLIGLYNRLSSHRPLRPSWAFFILSSLIGSLAFSIPLQLYLISRNHSK